MKEKPAGPPSAAGFTRKVPDINAGLTQQDVSKRIESGATNMQETGLTPSYPKIISRNIFSLFNLINVFLGVVVIMEGHPENAFFMLVAFCNSAMGIFQEIRSKRTLDKLSVLTLAKTTAVRDGKQEVINQNDIVLDDVLLLSAGDQICADAVVLSTQGLEVDESLLTGETDRIQKADGDKVLSGSYVTSGRAHVCVSAVGSDSYANSLTKQAKKEKKSKSKLLGNIKRIIRILTFVIIPLGLLLFYTNYSTTQDRTESVLGTTSAIIGMIPEGLVLLTGLTLTLGAVTLSRKKALVQSLDSIETLARVDVICLDKTGTITDGTLSCEETLLFNDTQDIKVQQVIKELMSSLKDENSTAKALRASFGESGRWIAEEKVPFSSDRKWSGATFRNEGSYIIGAPGVIFKGDDTLQAKAGEYADKGMRVVAIGYSPLPIRARTLPGELTCLAFVILSDTVRKDAKDTFAFFENEGITLKVISGDNPRTVSAVAAKAQLKNSDRFVDMSSIGKNPNYNALCERYTVFGHVSPQQKKDLITAMQENGHTTCMTGDGVNDILAMRQSDCSVAMVGGSDAARSACDFVLMSSTFNSMIEVLKEGRRVINNIDKVSALYLTKTIYSVLLTIIYIFLPLNYPFDPIHLTPVNVFTVGIPTFFLALLPNYSKPSERMMGNVIEHSFPAAMTVVFNTLYLQLASHLFELDRNDSATMITFLIGTVGFFLLLRVCKPLNKVNIALICVMALCFLSVFFIFGQLLTMAPLLNRNMFFYLPLMYFSFHIHGFLSKWCGRFANRVRR